MMDDMVWYRNSSDGEVHNVGDYDIAEVLEHLMHTIHLFGVTGAVTGSESRCNGIPNLIVVGKRAHFTMRSKKRWIMAFSILETMGMKT